MRSVHGTILLAAAFLAACDQADSGGDAGTPVPPPDKVDIVLALDNSRAMSMQAGILPLALQHLVAAFINPPCVDAQGVPGASQPAGPGDACPANLVRQFAPITDIHIGILSSSLGGHGADACPAMETFTCGGGATNTSGNDHGELLSRMDPCVGGMVATWQSNGFLAWDSLQRLTPPGESSSTTLDANIQTMVMGVGQVGCGYPSPLESWYRFLADPEPYATLQIDTSGRATPMGTDSTLLEQRARFLRPDSLLVILMQSAKNDCSIKESGQFYFAAQQRDPSNPNKNFYLPRARSECAANPNDPCCRSCGQDQSGCPADPNCAAGPLDARTDDVNLRCWDQKRRFGIDFLYPIDRYVDALAEPQVQNRAGEMVPNPIFSNLDAARPGAPVRDKGLVLLAGVVGVPWQDLARDPADLAKGYKDDAELETQSGGFTTWDGVIGDPASYVAPRDPHMIESNAPRTGTNPFGGVPLAPPGAPAGADPISGHEYTTGTMNGVQVVSDDLEYACIFPTATPSDCSNGSVRGCDCSDPLNDNPLCEPDPARGGDRTLQVRAKAYPGVRQLDVIRKLGHQGVAASICPAQTTDPARADYAYLPMVRAMLDRARARLPPASP